MRAAQETQMLRDRGTRHGKGTGDLPGGLAAPARQIEDGAAGGISKSLEGYLVVPRICNRSVTHNA
jgi:hypothetical protein